MGSCCWGHKESGESGEVKEIRVGSLVVAFFPRVVLGQKEILLGVTWLAISAR